MIMSKNKNILLIFFAILMLVGIGVIVYGIWFVDKPFTETLEEEIQKPIATIEIQDFGTIKLELEPKIAPETVANFISLANSGFYDGLTFHRTIPEFMIQGGDKEGTGSGEFEYTIKGEFTRNGVRNSLKHTRGVISMARADYGSGYEEYSYNSAGSQFFIVTADSTFLDGLYASFGTVIEGIEVADSIVNVDVVTREEGSEEADRPVNPPVITSIRVETFGHDYGEAEKLNLF